MPEPWSMPRTVTRVQAVRAPHLPLDSLLGAPVHKLTLLRFTIQV